MWTAVIIVALFLVVIWIFREDERRVTAQREAEWRRKVRLEEQAKVDAQRRKWEQDQAILDEARERARLAFPDLLDETEARATALDRAPEVDALIAEAREIVGRQPSLASGEEKSKLELNGFSKAKLQLAFVDEEADLEFGYPARVVDCGEAGSVHMFTTAQVQKAKEQAGLASYVSARDEAHSIARTILARALEQRRATEAHISSVTTKFEELPTIERRKTSSSDK